MGCQTVLAPRWCSLLPAGASFDDASKIQLMEGAFLFAIMWSVGATGDSAGRKRFNEFFRTLSMGGTPEGCVGGQRAGGRAGLGCFAGAVVRAGPVGGVEGPRGRGQGLALSGDELVL